MRYVAAVAITAAVIWALSYRTAATEPPPPPPIAVVDVTKVLTTSKAGKAAYNRLKQLQDARVKTASGLDAEVQALQKALDSGRMTMTEAKVAEATKVIADKRVAMQRYAKDADREVKDATDREMAALDEKIKPVIDAIAKEMGLTLVFNKFESGLLFASEAVDISDTVIARFNLATP